MSHQNTCKIDGLITKALIKRMTLSTTDCFTILSDLHSIVVVDVHLIVEVTMVLEKRQFMASNYVGMIVFTR